MRFFLPVRRQKTMVRKHSLSFLFVFALILSLALAGTVQAAPGQDNHKPVCPGPAGKDTARCHAWMKPDASTSPIGLTPARMKSAYHFSTSMTAGAGKRIAIVDAFDLPTAE